MIMVINVKRTGKLSSVQSTLRSLVQFNFKGEKKKNSGNERKYPKN